jgi:hypothetical protein
MKARFTTALMATLLAGASLGAFGALAGCSSARNLLGHPEGRCFRVLPQARRAVGSVPSFSGVRYLPAGQLVADIKRARQHGVKVPDALGDVASRPTCLVSFKGHFALSAVEKGWAPLPGPYLFAVVVTSQQAGTVVGTVLFHKIPLRFAKVFSF